MWIESTSPSMRPVNVFALVSIVTFGACLLYTSDAADEL